MGRRAFGSVRKLPSGRWQARYRNRGGRLVAAPMTFATKGDATAWLASTQTDQARGQFVDPKAGRLTLRQFSEQFLAGRVLSQRTHETYEGLLAGHILPILGDIEIGQIGPGTVRTWHVRLAKQHPSTAAKAYRLLGAMFNAAVRDELISRSPCRVERGGREDAAERPIANVAEVEALAEAMPARFRVVILLAAWCPLRKGELCALCRRDIDLLRSTVTVVQNLQQLRSGELVIKDPKTKAARRTIAMPSHVLPAITDHLERYTQADPDALVVTGEKGGPLRPHVLQKHWLRARLAIGTNVARRAIRRPQSPSSQTADQGKR